MLTARRRSNKQREGFLDKDDSENLYVKDVGGATTSPTTVGSTSDGTATELLVAATVAAAANNQTLAAAAGKRTYLAGFLIDGLGATGASVIQITFTGLADGDLSFRVSIPAGATTAITRLFVTFPRPLPASADNTAIVVNVPSFGAGNTAADAAAWGFRI